MTVLVGYLPTPVGEAAVTFGIDEARRRGEALLLVNCGQDPSTAAADLAGQEAMAAVRATLAGSGVEHEIRQYTTPGRTVAEEIVGVAENEGASVVVIGLRHRTATGKYLFGSTAQRILLDSGVPVIAVKTPK